MSRRFFKSFGLIALAVLVLYSGVAWAFFKCLHDGDSFLVGSSDSAAPRLECFDAGYPIGPMIKTVSPPRLVMFPDGVRSKDFPESAISRELKSFSPKSFFGRFRYSFLLSLSLHLFLSVFLI
jgi:hypothetical protein